MLVTPPVYSPAPTQENEPQPACYIACGARQVLSASAFVISFTDSLDRPELEHRLAPGFGGSHPGAQILFGLQRNVLLDFVAQPFFESRPAAKLRRRRNQRFTALMTSSPGWR
jgi:hypothetical protein